MKELKRFNLNLLIIAALSYLIMAILFFFVWPNQFHFSILFIPILLAGTTYVLHRKLIITSSDRPIKFINMFMAVTGIKLLVYLIVILLYVMFLTPYAIPFLAVFFPLYIVYTFIEISSLLKFLKTLDNREWFHLSPNS